uniref:Uncharacterized protein n=1 Tax=Astyanax mexicanus TaxID=7994 RepID=A0A3B1K6D4_ASTMX
MGDKEHYYFSKSFSTLIISEEQISDRISVFVNLIFFKALRLNDSLTHNPHNQQLSQKQQKVCHFVQHSHPKEQINFNMILYRKYLPTTLRMMLILSNLGPYLSVSVEESDTFLQTPKAALQTAQEEPAKTVFSACERGIEINKGAERAKGQRACRGADGERRDIIRFFQSPVVGGEGTGQGHLTKRSYEVHTPEEQEQVIELKNDKVLVVVSFSTIEHIAGPGLVDWHTVHNSVQYL